MKTFTKMGLSLTLSINAYAGTVITYENIDAPHSLRDIAQKKEPPLIENNNSSDQFIDIFKNATISGQIRSIYSQRDYAVSSNPDNYATALGGQLKYETSSFDGFSAAVAFYASQDINFATGSRSKEEQDSELSSDKGNFTQLAEAYVNYKDGNLNLRMGRQVVDTPLADSDAIRMIQNTFEAYLGTYTVGEFTFMAGKLQNWQGYDAGLADGYIPVGKTGAWLSSVAFSNNLFDVSTWIYNITDFSNILYTDASIHYNLSQDVFLHSSIQYINENELDDSMVNAQLYGAMAAVNIHGLTFTTAYNKAIVSKGKETFSGFGGGALYTSMDTMILNDIAIDRNSQAIVCSLSYALNNFKLLYAYGDFIGDRNSLGKKADIVEQNIGFKYNVTKNFEFSAVYTIDNDKIDSSNDQTNWNRLQLMATYNF